MICAIRPNLAPGSEKIAADIQAQFGNAVLDARLNPKIIESAEQEDRTRCRPVHADVPPYPEDAHRRSIQGQVYVEFSVMPDGRSRNPRIIYAVPAGSFEPTVRDALLHSEFVSAPAGRPPIQCTMFYRFQITGAVGYSGLDAYVDETLAHAKAGDPRAQMLYGMLLVGLPQLNKPRSQALPWFLKSAQAGIPSAQYQVGFSLLKGWGCNCEENKALDWLRRAAQAGQPDAEVTLAMYALKGSPDEERSRQAKLWLEQAAASGSHDGKLYLSALLAPAPEAQGGDPRRALTLLDEVFRGVKDDPIAFEIRAAAQASTGEFKEAAQSEAQGHRHGAETQVGRDSTQCASHPLHGEAALAWKLVGFLGVARQVDQRIVTEVLVVGSKKLLLGLARLRLFPAKAANGSFVEWQVAQPTDRSWPVNDGW